MSLLLDMGARFSVVLYVYPFFYLQGLLRQSCQVPVQDAIPSYLYKVKRKKSLMITTHDQEGDAN